MGGALFGPIGYLASATVSLLWIAWRHDNDLGAFLPLAMLVLIAVGVLALLIYLMLITHSR